MVSSCSGGTSESNSGREGNPAFFKNLSEKRTAVCVVSGWYSQSREQLDYLTLTLSSCGIVLVCLPNIYFSVQFLPVKFQISFPLCCMPVKLMANLRTRSTVTKKVFESLKFFCNNTGKNGLSKGSRVLSFSTPPWISGRMFFVPLKIIKSSQKSTRYCF